MIRRKEYSPAGTPIMVEYLNDPPPRPLNSIYLKKMGFESGSGNTYYRDNISIKYDGVYWWCYYFAASFKIETVEELEKLINEPTAK